MVESSTNKLTRMEFNITPNLQVIKLKVPKCEIFDPFDSLLYHKASLGRRILG